jgi:hypothetical protein
VIECLKENVVACQGTRRLRRPHHPSV